ncbi:hypothetical protein ABZ840_08515 [Streptomyces sp. NPDC047117]|uniref:hypothetical protein n=1 Tax=Streptomyces sp. NPDC047117 TaxID=3155379 RepID=UPI00340FD098
MAANIRSYHYTGLRGGAEYDHLVSLELGGDPNDPRNVWVEPPPPAAASTTPKTTSKAAFTKPAVCTRQVTLAAAQEAIATDWTTALTRLHLH